jgi:hypothetical protein
MQFKVDVDCTPAEARAFLGLPDLQPLHDRYIEIVKDAMSGQMSLEQAEGLMRNFAPFGDAGLRMFNSMVEMGMTAAGVATDKK